MCHVTVYSISGVVGHVPYVVPPLIAIMGKKSLLVRFRAFCRERVLERLRMGANRRDLFYHLVSSRTQDLGASLHLIERDDRVARNSLKVSAHLLPSLWRGGS